MRYDLTTIGEGQIRLTCERGDRLATARSLRMTAAGSEANVAGLLSELGRSTAWTTKLPRGELADRIALEYSAVGVDMSHVVMTDEGRVALYFLEPGEFPLPGKVTYDREYTPFRSIVPEDFDWDALLDTRLVFLTGITAALTPETARVVRYAADAARAENRDAPTVVITGGERTPSNALVGLVAIDALSTMRVEWVFLGAHGFTPEAGLMTPNLQEASANQALVAAGRTVVATLDSSKWGVLGLRSFCATRDIGVLVTEAEPDADGVDALQQAGTRLTIAT